MIVDTLVALFFGWLLGGGMGKHPAPSAKPEPIPPGKQPPKGPAPAPAPEPIVPPPNTPGYEQPPPGPEPPKGKATPEPVPQSYKPPGGWVPYITQWTVARAKYYLANPSILPVGTSIQETDPKGITVKFRAETGAQHGDTRKVRAVTAWRKAA